jgi:tetratricopeptide (TPR) repeat protein
MAIAFLALAAPAGPVFAQTTASFTRADGGGPPVDVARAVALEAQADELCTCLTNCLKIARLYEEAASLRPQGDPQKAVDHELAGMAYHHLGKLRQAQEHTIAAAEAFLAVGDVVNAAHKFINAATVAQERKRHEEAQKLVQRAECLAKSPLLTLAEADRILSRIQPTGRMVVVRRAP